MRRREFRCGGCRDRPILGDPNRAPIGLELSVTGTSDAAEVERGIAELADQPNGGLVVIASDFGANHPRLIAALAARHNLI